jgi:hypothetical protein
MNVDLGPWREHGVGPNENSRRTEVEDDASVAGRPVEELAGEPALDSLVFSSLHSSAARRGEFQPLLGACVIGPRDLRVDACVRWRQVAARVGGKSLRAWAASVEQGLRQSLDSKSERPMCNSSARQLRTMNFVQFSLKRTVEKSDAGIAPQCLQDAAGSRKRPRAHCFVLHD